MNPLTTTGCEMIDRLLLPIVYRFYFVQFTVMKPHCLQTRGDFDGIAEGNKG
jgi:hypothetical protein